MFEYLIEDQETENKSTKYVIMYLNIRLTIKKLKIKKPNTWIDRRCNSNC